MPLALFWLALFIAPARATMLVNRPQFSSTKVLPRGLWTFGMSYARWSTASGSYSDTGKRVSNQDYFSRDVSYAGLQDEMSDPLERELAHAAFEAYGKKDEETAGRSINDVNIDQQSSTYVLGYGATKRSSFFLILPVVTLQTSFRSRFVPSPSLTRLANQLRAEGQYSQAEEIIENTSDALRNRLQETGYQSDYPARITTLANAFLTHRYAAQTGSSWEFSSESSLVIPAGKSSGVDDFLYLRFNEEQYSARQALTLSYVPHGQWSLLTSGYYHKRFPFYKKRRIPVNAISPLSEDIDPSTRIQYGDTWGVSGQLNFSRSDSFLFYAGHSREFKQSDRIDGDEFAPRRYDYLELNTDQRLAINYVGMSVNTIQTFLADDFPVPIDLNVQFSQTTSGQNAFANQAIAATLMVFYK